MSAHDNEWRRKPRYSIWSLLAPAALIVVIAVTYATVAAADRTEKPKTGSGKAAATSEDTSTDTLNSSDTSTTASGTVDDPEQTTTVPEAGAKRFVKVESGDTLAAIAAREGVTIEDITRLNPTADSQSLTIGQKVRVE